MASFFPLIIFLVLYLTSSFIGYKILPVVCTLPALVFAVLFSKNKIQHNISTIIEGMGKKDTINMCLILLFSGAFAVITKSIGSTDVVVNLILKFLPIRLLLPGIFLVSAFISTAIGTSMGVVALVTPIAVNLANSGAFGLEIGVATVIGGSMFGDNLSMISDTTIISVSSQGSSVIDKLKLNLKVSSIAGIITLIYLTIISNSTEIIPLASDLDYLSIMKIIPYVSLVAMSFFEINVLVTLFVNIIIAVIIGITLFDYSIVQYSNDIQKGFQSVNGVMVLFLFMSGLGHLMCKHEALDSFINEKLHKFIHRGKGSMTQIRAEFALAIIPSIFTVLVASNTIAILLSGDIAKKIAQKYEIPSHRSAYLLDTFACIVKGILPYGSQILLAGSIASIPHVVLSTKVYYCFVLAVVAVGEIIIRGMRSKTVVNAESL